jgi:hypothetical protein
LQTAQREAASLRQELEDLRLRFAILSRDKSLSDERLSSTSKALDRLDAELAAVRAQSAALMLWATGGIKGAKQVNRESA